MDEEKRLSFDQDYFNLDNIIPDINAKTDKEIVEDFKQESRKKLDGFKVSIDSAFSPFQQQESSNEDETKKKRKRTDKETKEHLLNWLNDHIDHPYPDEFEKELLQNETNMTRSQIDNWFINARRRYLPSKKSMKRNIHQ